MTTFSNQIDEAGYGNYAGSGGGYGMGGGGLWFIVIALIFWFLFDGRGKRDGFDGHCGCNPIRSGCKPVFDDESNYEEERNLDNKICCSTDKILAGQAHMQEKADERYILSLRDAVAEKNTEIIALKGQIYSDAKFGEVYKELSRIQCKMPELRPQWACTQEACAVTAPVCNPREPRRGRCDFDDVCFA